MLSRFNAVASSHVFQEDNSIADALAKHGLSLNLELKTNYDIFPNFCFVPFMLDNASTIY